MRPTPLEELFRRCPLLESTEFGDVAIVSTFGHPQLEYAALHSGCGLFDCPHRGLIELTGSDRHAFVGNLVSNRTFDAATRKGMNAGTGVAAFLLNLRGRVVAELNLIECGDRLLIECDVRLAGMLVDLFDRYLFGERVKVVDRSASLHEIAMLGPTVPLLLNEMGVGGVADLPRLGTLTGRLGDVEVLVWRDDITATPGLHVVTPSASALAVTSLLLDRFAGPDWPDPTRADSHGRRRLQPVGWAAFNAARIEAGRPILGIDFEPAEPSIPGRPKDAAEPPGPQRGILPAETGQLDRFVDFNKGCYLGQEIVARMHARGQLARKIVAFRMTDDALPIAGAEVLDADRNQIGIVTSSTVSPIRSNAAIGLALVKKPHYQPGSTLTIPAEGAYRSAVVVGASGDTPNRRGEHAK